MQYAKNFGSITRQEQEKLKRSSILVVGAGAIGELVIEGFARMGVGKLIVLDKDYIKHVDIVNHTFSMSNNIGKEKIHVAREVVKKINPEINFNGLHCDLDIESMDLIIDCSDDLDTKKYLKQKSRKLQVPLITQVTGNLEAIIFSINCEEDFFEENLKLNIKKLDYESESIFFLSSMVASIQLCEGTKILLEDKKNSFYEEIFLDLKTGNMKRNALNLD